MSIFSTPKVAHTDLKTQLESRWWFRGYDMSVVNSAGRRAGPKPPADMAMGIQDRPRSPSFVHPNQAKVL